MKIKQCLYNGERYRTTSAIQLKLTMRKLAPSLLLVAALLYGAAASNQCNRALFNEGCGVYISDFSLCHSCLNIPRFTAASCYCCCIQVPKTSQRSNVMLCTAATALRNQMIPPACQGRTASIPSMLRSALTLPQSFREGSML